MSRTQTMVQLTDDLVAALDAEAARRGVSRSALIREAVSSHLAEKVEEAVGAAIVDGYRRVPPSTPDEWGSPEEFGDVSTRETAQRLDAEERARGFETW